MPSHVKARPGVRIHLNGAAATTNDMSYAAAASRGVHFEHWDARGNQMENTHFKHAVHSAMPSHVLSRPELRYHPTVGAAMTNELSYAAAASRGAAYTEGVQSRFAGVRNVQQPLG
jgi:hypothetical protein